MRWHKKGVCENDELIVPSDEDAWKAFDMFDPDFAAEPRNVRISLATDGFTPFGQMASSYSCWPVFVIPHNLPPSLCMKYEFIFPCLIIPGVTPGFKGQNRVHLIHAPMKTTYIITEYIEINVTITSEHLLHCGSLTK
jgi:hypothetical protein